MGRFFNNNLVLRITAIVLACILWFTVNAPQSSSSTQSNAPGVKDFPYAVQVNVGPDMMVTQVDHPTVVVEVKGNTVTTSSLPSEMMGVQVTADANGLSAGTHLVALKAQGMPAVTYSIIPSSVQVTLDKKVTASKPIKIQVTGSPAKGYQVGQVQTDVQSVQVSGVSSAVSRVANVTAQISVKGAKTAVSHTLTLEPVDKNGNAVAGVEVDPVNVTTVVHIEPPQVSIQLTPELFGTPAPGYAVSGVSLANTSVNITAPPDVTSNLSNITVPVDVNGLQSTTTEKVAIVPQSGWTQVSPSSVEATVNITSSAARLFNSVPLDVINVPQGLQVNLGQITSLNIRVSGPAAVVSQMTTADVVAQIDASQLSLGDTSATVSVSVPRWVSVTQLSQTSIPLTVSPPGAANNSASGNASGSNGSGATNKPGGNNAASNKTTAGNGTAVNRSAGNAAG